MQSPNILKAPLKSMGEEDALTSWKQFYNWRPRTRHYWKNLYNRRIRRMSKEIRVE